MRKIIIDTDTASDDAAALMMAAFCPDIELLGVTVLAGNVSLEQAGNNALMTLEVCGNDTDVYLGAKQPLFHKREETISVHGKDGMGDKDLIHPVKKAAKKRAVDFILDMAQKYPDELEIIATGPVTNIALAILQDRETMSHVKRIWSMGTPGFGPGNATPVSEFNVFIDAEAYALMLGSEIPVSIAGFDLCVGDIEIDKYELSYLNQVSKAGKFLHDATSVLLEFNQQTRGQHMVDLPDAVAMATAIWPEVVTGRCAVHCECCNVQGPAYGQVIFYKKGSTYESMPALKEYKDEVITSVDKDLFTKKFMDMFEKNADKPAKKEAKSKKK